MKTNHVYSGLHADGYSSGEAPVPWTVRALKRHQEWCKAKGLQYTYVNSGMPHWASLAAYPGAWTFGTFIKFEAMRIFLRTPAHGDMFVWMDLDVYPKDTANLEDWVQEGRNTAVLSRVSPDYCGWPGMKAGHFHMWGKLAWTGLHRNPDYLALSSGMFCFTREAVESFWAWLNRNHSIDSQAWWDAYEENQNRCSRIATGIKRPFQPFVFGSEETLLEEWVNEHPIECSYLDHTIHGLCDGPGDPGYVHYYGRYKEDYPE